MLKKNGNISLWKYFSKYKLIIALYIVIYLLASGCIVLSTIFFAKAVEAITLAEYKLGITYLAISGATVLFKRFSWFIADYIYFNYSSKIVADLNLDLARQAFKLNSKTYADHETGLFVQRIVSDPESAVRNLSELVDIITEVVTSAVIIIYITVLNYIVGIAIMAVIGICLCIEKIRRSCYKKNKFLMRRENDKIYSLTTEIVRSEKDVKSLGLENKLEQILKANYDAYKDSTYKFRITDAKLIFLRNLLVEICGIAILILGIYMIDLSMLTLASFMIIYSNNGQLYILIYSIAKISDILLEVNISTTRMFSLFENNEFVCERFGNVHLDNIKGQIEFKNVSYTFVEYERNDDKKYLTPKELRARNKTERKIESKNKIFNKLSFKIEPNTTVAFVGRSGTGKSTILNLMSKMYEVDSGEVLIDGVNINDLDKETLRGSISLVNQFPYIFDMSIRDNLLLAKRDATDEEINRALEKASLKDFVSSLKKGVNTVVGESGIKLSGGQKQRLAIARALLRNSPIIIFDESTSSLDNFAQEDIKRTIDGLKGNSTIIIVAHRLSTIRNVDKIFFLEEGEIEDFGTFDELFENNVKFKNMFYAENLN